MTSLPNATRGDFIPELNDPGEWIKGSTPTGWADP